VTSMHEGDDGPPRSAGRRRQGSSAAFVVVNKTIQMKPEAMDTLLSGVIACKWEKRNESTYILLCSFFVVLQDQTFDLCTVQIFCRNDKKKLTEGVYNIRIFGSAARPGRHYIFLFHLCLRLAPVVPVPMFRLMVIIYEYT
jgi:hypothetical protein